MNWKTPRIPNPTSYVELALLVARGVCLIFQYIKGGRIRRRYKRNERSCPLIRPQKIGAGNVGLCANSAEGRAFEGGMIRHG